MMHSPSALKENAAASEVANGAEVCFGKVPKEFKHSAPTGARLILAEIRDEAGRFVCLAPTWIGVGQTLGFALRAAGVGR
jgi:hypothetical protein